MPTKIQLWLTKKRKETFLDSNPFVPTSYSTKELPKK